MAGGVLFPPPYCTSAETHLPDIRVVVLGDALVGKTSLLRQYLDHEGPPSSFGYEPTLLDSYTRIEYCGRQPYRVHFTDCSSTPEFREHRAAYLAKCDVVVLVFSALHRKTLTNLRDWMKEVVHARTSAGPARFASTTGDFSEVPVFLVGTHYGEKPAPATQKPVSLAEAESVTVDCLHSAGYFVSEEDAGAEKELRLQRIAAAQKDMKTSKKKRSPRAFRGFFADLFKSNLSDAYDDGHYRCSKSKPSDKKDKKDRKGETEQDPSNNLSHDSPSSRSRSASQSLTPYVSTTVKSHSVGEALYDGGPPSKDSPLFALPPGASPRLPLFMLSNKDSGAVNTAVRASLALHLWLKQLDYSNEVSPGVTPLTSPRVRSSAVLVNEPPTSSSNGGHSGSTPPAEMTGLVAPQHRRSVSAASHTSRMSERTAASVLPSMHALYGSVASLSPFDASYQHSCATSSGPLTDGNSPHAPGQPTHILVMVGDSPTFEVSSSPELDGKTSTGPYPSSAHNAPRSSSGVQNQLSWCSSTAVVRAEVEEGRASASASSTSAAGANVNDAAVGGLNTTPPAALCRVSSGHSPVELDATVCDVTPVREDGLVQATASICFSSPPNPRRATAPNTAMEPGSADHPASRSTSTQCGEYSTLSGKIEGNSAHPLPAWATADTPAPRGNVRNDDGGHDVGGRVWKDIDAEEHRGNAPKGAGAGEGYATDSVVKKLALEHESRSAAASSATSSPQGPLVKSAGTTPANSTPRASPAASAPIHAHDGGTRNYSCHNPSGSMELSVSTLRSPTSSSRSRKLTHTHSRSPSHASTPQSQAAATASRSQTRPPAREGDELAKSSPLSQSGGGHSHALTKDNAQQKQKANQCTSDGCNTM
jgi:GTPase SAR1 family protein